MKLINIKSYQVPLFTKELIASLRSRTAWSMSSFVVSRPMLNLMVRAAWYGQTPESSRIPIIKKNCS